VLHLIAANNLVASLGADALQRYAEVRSLLRKTIPVARRTLGEADVITLSMRSCYASALYLDDSSTLDDLREAVTTLEDAMRASRRALGRRPSTEIIEHNLQAARAVLDARSRARSRLSFGGAAANLPDALFFAFVVAVFAWALEPFWR